MKIFKSFFVLLIVPIFIQPDYAQSISTGSTSLSLQPDFWLDSLVPSDLTGFSLQFETPLSIPNSIALRGTWFRNPLIASAVGGVNGFAFSAEYRHYFSGLTTGWHLGPFAEYIGFEGTGNLHSFYGSGLKNVFDFGIVAGHKWMINRINFDISVRTSWYSPYSAYPRDSYFPQFGSNFNSLMILTVGYTLY